MSTPLITLYPSFYSRFTCKAGDCVHSCCVQDWEIDIDDDTAALYQSMDGPLGEEIRKAMRKNEETYYWDMKDGKCPFLNKQGLCRIVLEKGENALCDICAMHPRFFVYAGNFELAGTGLCCEKTVELLLEEKGSLVFVTDYPEEKASLASLLHALGYKADKKNLIFSPSISTICYEQLLSHYEKTEPINAAWTASLLHMKTHVQRSSRPGPSAVGGNSIFPSYPDIPVHTLPGSGKSRNLRTLCRDGLRPGKRRFHSPCHRLLR